MATYEGTLVRDDGSEPSKVRFIIDGDLVRVTTTHRPLGVWQKQDITCERTSVFRFAIGLDDTTYNFSPLDPAGFADDIGAVVDLRPKSRFGLADRVRAALAEEASAGPLG